MFVHVSDCDAGDPSDARATGGMPLVQHGVQMQSVI
jgi:hypothetical protein